MSEKETIDLKSGDSAVVIRHDKNLEGGFIVEVYHNMDRKKLTV